MGGHVTKVAPGARATGANGAAAGRSVGSATGVLATVGGWIVRVLITGGTGFVGG